jgi:RNA polymerase sigma factor (sigma-70 family)
MTDTALPPPAGRPARPDPAAAAAADPTDAGPGDGDDAALIARSLHAPECFGMLFDRHAPAIGRYVARRLGPDAADDLVAETFLAAFRRRGRYDLAYGDARPWLYGIATRLIGRHRREEVRFFRAIARTGVDPAAEPVADEVTDRVAAQAARRELATALARLSQDQRDVLLLVASGLAYEETALALGVPAGTVSSRLVRARRKVREALGGQDPTRPGEDTPE